MITHIPITNPRISDLRLFSQIFHFLVSDLGLFFYDRGDRISHDSSSYLWYRWAWTWAAAPNRDPKMGGPLGEEMDVGRPGCAPGLPSDHPGDALIEAIIGGIPQKMQSSWWNPHPTFTWNTPILWSRTCDFIPISAMVSFGVLNIWTGDGWFYHLFFSHRNWPIDRFMMIYLIQMVIFHS